MSQPPPYVPGHDLLAGEYRHSECIGGEVRTGLYLPGGYVYRPAGTINGGPSSGGLVEAIWLLRETQAGAHTIEAGCGPTP